MATYNNTVILQDMLVPMKRGPWFLERLTTMAQALEAKFNIIQLDCDADCLPISDRICQLLHDEEMSLSLFNVRCLGCLTPGCHCKDRRIKRKNKNILSLMQKSKEWKTDVLLLFSHMNYTWMDTAVIDKGLIGELTLYFFGNPMVMRLDDFKRVWNRAEKFNLHGDFLVNDFFEDLTFGGGMGDNPEGDWKLVLDKLASVAE